MSKPASEKEKILGIVSQPALPYAMDKVKDINNTSSRSLKKKDILHIVPQSALPYARY